MPLTSTRLFMIINPKKFNKMKEKKNIVPMPIDNKHILEDFTDELHGGDCIELRKGRVVNQTFYFEGFLCLLYYKFGDSHFHVVFLQDLSYDGNEEYEYDGNDEYALQKMKEKLELLSDEDNGLIIKIIDNVGRFCCFFYKVVD